MAVMSKRITMVSRSSQAVHGEQQAMFSSTKL